MKKNRAVQTVLHALLAFFSLLFSQAAFAAGEWVQLDSRPGVTLQLYWMPSAEAKATVLLVPGGNGFVGDTAKDEPTSKNFVVRSRNLFRKEGFNVLILGMPSDKTDQDLYHRASDNHMTDIQKAIAFAKSKSDVPVWAVGTSLGTVSTAQAAIVQGNGTAMGLAGIVLTSTITSWKHPNTVPKLDLAKIKVPTLIYHHANDACNVCQPGETAYILDHLTNASIKKRMLVTGGDDKVTGDPCLALHFHGYRGIERQAVADIAGWIKKPTS